MTHNNQPTQNNYHLVPCIKRSACKTTPGLGGWKNVQTSRPVYRPIPRLSQIYFLVNICFFYFTVPCGRLSWLLVCFWAHVNIFISYRKLLKCCQHTICLMAFLDWNIILFQAWRHWLRWQRLWLMPCTVPPFIPLGPLTLLCQDGWGHIRFHQLMLTQVQPTGQLLSTQSLSWSLGWVRWRMLRTNLQTRISRPPTLRAKNYPTFLFICRTIQ